MLQTLKDVTLNILGRIPLVRRFVPQEYGGAKALRVEQKTRPELEGYHRVPDSRGFSPPGPQPSEHAVDLSDWSTDPNVQSTTTTKSQNVLGRHIKAWQRDGSNAIQELLKSPRPNEVDRFENMPQEIVDHILRSNNNPLAPIEFQTDLLINSARGCMDQKIKEEFYTKFAEINEGQRNDPELYFKVFDQFITNTINFILDLNNRTLLRTISIENYNDLDVAKAFKLNRQLSKTVAEKALDAIIDSFPLLPTSYIDANDTEISFIDYIGIRLEESIRTLYLTSKFGMHSKDIVNRFKDTTQRFQLEGEDFDQTVFFSQKILNELHGAIHGSLIQDPNDLNNHTHEVADTDPFIVDEARRLLVDLMMQNFEIKYDDIRDEDQRDDLIKLDHSFNNLVDFLRKMAYVEQEVAQTVQSVAHDDKWSALRQDSKAQLAEISKTYNIIHKTDRMLGYTHPDGEMIAGRLYPQQSMLNYLLDENVDRHFKRMILETCLLALFDVSSTERDVPVEGGSLMYHPNFQTIPWLQEFYLDKREEYRAMIEDESVTDNKLRNHAKLLCKIGAELHSIDQGSMFRIEDFRHRYNVAHHLDEMMRRAADFTDAGILALNTEFFSNLFTFLTAGQYEGLSEVEVQRVKTLVNFVKNVSTIRDEHGRPVYAPKSPNPLAKAKSQELKEIFGSRGFLTLNTSLIIKFLLQTVGFGIDGKKKVVGESFDDRNAILASLLFYVLVKYLPETSGDIDSLRARSKVFKTMLDLSNEGEDALPILFTKLRKQALGLDDDLVTPRYDGKQGVFKALGLDLDKKIEEYPLAMANYRKAMVGNNQAEAAKHLPGIPLKQLLEVYADVDACVKRNSDMVKGIEIKLQRTKNINEPLVKGLPFVIETVLDEEPKTVVDFVKNYGDQDLSRLTQKLLLDRAAKMTREIMQTRVDADGCIEIEDNDDPTIQKLSRCLQYTKYLGELLDQHGVNNLNVNEEMISKNEDDASRQKIRDDIQAVKSLMSRKVSALMDPIRSQEEVFSGQLEAKRMLMSLLREPDFNFKPAYGARIDWYTPNQKEKLKKSAGHEYKIVA